MSTATYTRNRSPTKSLNNTTPFECLFNRKPDVSNLRVFGCVAYTHIPDHQRMKLEEKSRKCTFVRYPDGTKAFTLYDLTKEAFIRSRDVIFEERTFHEFKRQKSSEQNSEFFYPPKENCAANPLINQNEIQVENIDQRRQRRPPERYEEMYVCADDLTSDINKPRNLSEAWSNEHNAQWKKATDSEFNALMENDTWQLVPPPENKNMVGSRWVSKVKRNADGSVERFKARLVAQGYSQAEGIDYHEVFSPVVRSTSVRLLLALANTLDWDIHQMNVKTAFLQGDLTEDIYMKQPEGYRSKEHPDYVCKLNKSLYGLKQSARCWNSALDSYLKSVIERL